MDKDCLKFWSKHICLLFRGVGKSGNYKGDSYSGSTFLSCDILIKLYIYMTQLNPDTNRKWHRLLGFLEVVPMKYNSTEWGERRKINRMLVNQTISTEHVIRSIMMALRTNSLLVCTCSIFNIDLSNVHQCTMTHHLLYKTQKCHSQTTVFFPHGQSSNAWQHK